MTHISYSEKIILEHLEMSNDWWYGMYVLANQAGFCTRTTRYLLDGLCRKGLVTKLIDSEGEGYYLAEEE